MSATISHPSMARTASRFVLGTLWLVTLLPGLMVAVLGWSTAHERAQASARATAWLVERWAPTDASGITIDAAAWNGHLADLARQPGLHAQGEARDILAPDGRSLASAGDERARAWPAMTIEQELKRGSETLGHVRIVVTLRPAVGWALLSVLVGGLVALGLWVLAFTHPISLMRQTEGRLRGMAHHDSLTGLYNLDGLRQRIQLALQRRKAGSRTTALLVVDLDRFRIVNDSLGHPGGDALLRSVADRIRAVTRPADALARLGADQFGILVEGIGGAAAAANMARNLLRAMAPSYLLDGREAVVGLSIGVAVAGEGIDGTDAMLQAAQAAMRAAKASGGGCFRLYKTAMAANLQQRLELEQDLRRALQQREFSLAFQPIMEGCGRSFAAVEALLRWSDPMRGTIAPADFIPVLEETGQILEVGRWVLHEACRSACAWRADGGPELSMSVNVSPRQFAEPDFVQMVLRVLAETGFPPQKLQLEVTEGLLLEPTPDCQHKIDVLTQHGVSLTIDDFGMGYSSLAYLKRFKLHALKIDRLFVRDLAQHSQDAAIARAIIDLGHGLGMRVIAEGVETEAQFHALRRLGCDGMQGYLFARPMPDAELRGLMNLPAQDAERVRRIAAAPLSAATPA